MTKRRPRFNSAVLRFCATVAAFSVAGCRDDPNGGVDHAYIRTGETETIEDAKPAPSPATLFPMDKGRQWRMTIRIEARDGSQIKTATEVITATGPATIASVSGKSLSLDQKGVPLRSELFALSNKGLSQIAAGGTQKMIMSPPMPIFAAPIKEGSSLSWEGEIRMMGQKNPATGFSRVSGKDTIQTPAGKFEAWRVDSVLTTIAEGRQIAFPITRWLAPGVGVVKQRYIIGDAVVVKELTSYTKK